MEPADLERLVTPEGAAVLAALTANFKRGVSLCGLQVHPTVAGRSGNG